MVALIDDHLLHELERASNTPFIDWPRLNRAIQKVLVEAYYGQPDISAKQLAEKLNEKPLTIEYNPNL